MAPSTYRLDSKFDLAALGLVDFPRVSLVVRERDHVVFDVFTQAMTPKWSLVEVVVALTVVVAMLWSFAPVWDAIFGSRLMDLKKIQTLRVPITGDKIAIK